MSDRSRRDAEDADERVLRHMVRAGEFDDDVRSLDERERNSAQARSGRPEAHRKEMSFKGYSVPVCASLRDIVQQPK